MKQIYAGWDDLKIAPPLVVENDPATRWYGWLFAKVNGEWMSVADLKSHFPFVAKPGAES